jgi:hypothetical protein
MQTRRARQAHDPIRRGHPQRCGLDSDVCFSAAYGPSPSRPAPEPPATQTRTRRRRRAAPKAREPGPGITRMNLHCEGPGPDSERRTPARASESPRAGEPLASWDSPADAGDLSESESTRTRACSDCRGQWTQIGVGGLGQPGRIANPDRRAEEGRPGRVGARPDSEANPDR